MQIREPNKSVMDTDIIDALGKGKRVANPEIWKERGITTNKIFFVVSLLIVLLKSKGIDPPIDDDALIMISGGIAAFLLWLNNIITAASSKRAEYRMKLELTIIAVMVAIAAGLHFGWIP